MTDEDRAAFAARAHKVYRLRNRWLAIVDGAAELHDRIAYLVCCGWALWRERLDDEYRALLESVSAQYTRRPRAPIFGGGGSNDQRYETRN